MMINIGIVSGEILELFDEVKGPLTDREIGAYLGYSKEDILMSLGWLIRERLITMEEMGENIFFISKKNIVKEQGVHLH